LRPCCIKSMELIRSKSDLVGSAASVLCAVHCAVTPLLFVAQSCSVAACCDSGPTWWSSIDYVFIAITFFAVYYSAKRTSKAWMKYSLFGSWVLLSLLVVNEKVSLFPIADLWKYLSALLLIALHLFNRKYCQCEPTTHRAGVYVKTC